MLPKVPDLLLTTQEQWRSIRRPEILELFRKHIHGRNPIDRPHQMSFTLTHKDPAAMNDAATLKQINITYTGPHGTAILPIILFTPNQRTGPVPTFLYINIKEREKRIDPTRQHKHEVWPAETLIERGYATAAYQVDDLAPNLRPPSKSAQQDPTSAAQSVFETPGALRAPDAWGTIATWAWGASRIMDYLETDPAIDPNRIAIIGHSRAGKTALWAGAQDERFALVISNNSGSTGAALARGKSGIKAESIADINTGFPLWFCENYKQYNHNEETLPIDQHMLLALIAPRLLYVASAADDTWAHPPSEYAALLLAQPLWQLYNKPTLPITPLPRPNSPLHTTPTAYHIRPGPHGLTTTDWTHYLNYADKHLKPNASSHE